MKFSSPGFAGFWLLASGLSLFGGNWPAWRGPTGMGVTSETDLPTKWSATEHVRWKTPLPERGNSSPIVWGNRVFITQAVESKHQRNLLCFDRANGKLIWEKGVTYTEKEPSHETNPYCSASPVTDGQRVMASFGSAGLYCYDFQGNEIWHRDFGPQIHIWGNASSPVIAGDLCYLNVGPGENTMLVALDKRSGKTVWEKKQAGNAGLNNKPADWVGSWTTPVVAKFKDQTQLIMSWPERMVAYDPKSGAEIWTCRGLNPLVYTSPLVSEEIVVAMGGFSGSSLAVKAGGMGDVTETHRLWQVPKTAQRIGSGVIHDKYIYILDDPGIAECIELETGKMIWQERLTGKGPRNSSWSSLVLAGDRLYALNHSGDGFILKAAPKFEVLETNSLGEETLSSPAISDGEIFIRTYRNLWCITR